MDYEMLTSLRETLLGELREMRTRLAGVESLVEIALSSQLPDPQSDTELEPEEDDPSLEDVGN